jgi:hypothetical protein
MSAWRVSDPEDALARAMRTTEYKRAEEDLEYVAVCLIGHGKEIPTEVGSNRTVCPVAVVWSRDPAKAGDQLDRGNAIHKLLTLRHVWVRTLPAAKRLKAALDVRILGNDPAMVALRHNFRDLPEWEVAWDILLKDAIEDLRQNGETIETTSDEMKIRKTLNRARELAMGR